MMHSSRVGGGAQRSAQVSIVPPVVRHIVLQVKKRLHDGAMVERCAQAFPRGGDGTPRRTHERRGRHELQAT